MGNAPVLKAEVVVKILKKLGFVELRQRGSHKQFKHSDGRFTTVPVHKRKDISPVLLRVIAKGIGLNVHDLLKEL